MKRWLVVLSVMVLAGCADEPPAPPVEDPCLIESAGDLESCPDDDRDPDQVAHLHDYWQGQDRVALMDMTISGGGQIAQCDGWPWYVLRPEAPNTVFQGAASGEVTMSWTDEPTDLYSAPELWIKTAAMDAAEPVGPIGNGETLAYASDNDHNDLPHQLLSAWEFTWYIHPGNDNDPLCNLWHHGDLTLRVEIVRGIEIPLYPGHPDRWDNRTEIVALDGGRQIGLYAGNEGGGMCLDLPGSTGCLWDPHVPDDGVVIPHDADMVVVELTPDSPVFGLELAFHAADTRDLTYAGPTLTNGAVQVYEIPVSGGMGDGPYALQSLWEFHVYPTQNLPLFGGTYDQAGYTIRVTAYPEPA